MAVRKQYKKLFFKIFEVPELLAANVITNCQERYLLRKYKHSNFRLSGEQKKDVREFWKPYCRISTDWAAYYCSANGIFDPRYIPNDLYYTVIDQHFNSRKLGYGFNDKNYYSKIFDEIPQPKTLLRKINGLLFDANYNQISVREGGQIISNYDEIICKPSQETGSGRGIEFIKTASQGKIESILNNTESDDYIIQTIISQHPKLSEIHKSSINSIRICSLLMNDGVHILSAVLRMGSGGSRVDNATAGENARYGGLTVGIKEDGTLKKYGYTYYAGEKVDKHPGGFLFEGFRVPSFEKAVELVRTAHPRIAHFRLVSWDIAIDAEDKAVLIEANMRKGSINFHQFNNGPLFENVMFESMDGNMKSLTASVLNEVFK